MIEQDCEQLTLFPADSPANPSVWLESKRAGTMSATFGLKCCELSENLRRVGLSVRTYLESCELPPGTWSRTWSAKVMTSRCLILKLRLSERRTNGQGSRLWPTCTSSEAEHGGPNSRYGRGNMHLSAAVLWPTPRAKEDCDYQYSAGRKGHKVLTLSGKAKLFPTPTASEAEHGSPSSTYGNGSARLTGAAMMYPTPRAQSANGQADPPNRQGGADLQSMAGGQLNPTWVEWLMGYPLGWTELNASETP